MNIIPDLNEIIKSDLESIHGNIENVFEKLDFNQLMGSVLKYYTLLEFSHIHKVGRYERSSERTDYLNSHRTRVVQLPTGKFVLKIPRQRKGKFTPSFFNGKSRVLPSVVQYVKNALLCGISEKQICELTEMTTGLTIPKDTMKEVKKHIDELIYTFKNAPITTEYEYLFLDAMRSKDIINNSTRRITILTCVGVTIGGTKEVIAYSRVATESKETWRKFVLDLLFRGLNRDKIRLITSDAHKGLVGVIEDEFYGVPHQLCLFHRRQSAYKYVNDRSKTDWLDMRNVLYDSLFSPTRKQCDVAFARWLKDWGYKYHGIAVDMKANRHKYLEYLNHEVHKQRYIRTNNPIERVFKDVRAGGFSRGAFSSPEHCDRVVYTVFNRLNKKWAGRFLWVDKKREYEAELTLQSQIDTYRPHIYIEFSDEDLKNDVINDLYLIELLKDVAL